MSFRHEYEPYIVEALAISNRDRGLSIDMIYAYVKENYPNQNIERDDIMATVIRMNAWGQGVEKIGRHNYILSAKA